MTSCSYASLISVYNSNVFSLAPMSGGSTTSTTNLYYFACGLVRGGINLLTSLGQVSVASGQKLRFTVNSSARPAGLDPFGFILGAAATNDPTAAKVLAVLYVKEPDQVSDRNLPIYLDLTANHHFTLSGQVANFAALPSSPVNGEIRFVQNESKYYQYDAEGWHPNTEGNLGWIQVYGDGLYLADTLTLRSGTLYKGGCNVPIDSFNDSQTSDEWGIIPPPIWASQGATSSPIKIWLTNQLTEGSGVIVPQSSAIAFLPRVNDDEELGAILLSGNTQITPTKRIRLLDGTASNLSNAPLVWVSGNPFYTNPSDLNPGYALEFSVTTSATVGNGDRVSFLIYNYGLIGNQDYNDSLGSAIFAELNQALIVPSSSGIKRLSGTGRIDTANQSGGYTFYATGNLDLSFGIANDTANQKVAIAGLTNGGIVIRQNGTDLLDTEALRAIISTEPGTAAASGWSNAVTLGANSQLSVVITLPTAIRSDYPDTAIAGNTNATRQIPLLLPYVRVGGVIKRGTAIAVGAGATQTITVSNLGSWTTVGSLPTNGDPDFNLWGYGNATASAGVGTGTLGAGSYDFAYAWYYPSSNSAITKISHAVEDGCIPVFSLSFAEALEQMQYAGLVSASDAIPGYLSDKIPSSTEITTAIAGSGNKTLTLTPKYWRLPVATKSDLKALPLASLTNFEARIVQENYKAYVFDNSSSVTDDDDNTLQPNDATGNGRWRSISGGSGAGGSGGHTIVNSSGTSLNQRSKLKFNNSYFSLADSAGTDTTLVNVSYTPANQARTITTNNGLTGGGDLSSDRTLGISLSGLTENTTPIGTDLALLQTGSGIQKIQLTNLLSKLPFTTKGSFLVGNGTNLTQFSVGTDGYILTADSGSSTGLSWVANTGNVVTTTTSASYTQPTLNGTVSITVGKTSNFIAGISYIDIETGGHYLVTAIASAISMTVQYLGGGIASGTAIASGKKITPTGKPGSDGKNSQTTTSANFTVPAADGTTTVDISVVDSSIFNSEIEINIESAGYYFITQVVSSTVIRCKNKGYGVNANAGTIIASGSKVIITGVKGIDIDINLTTDGSTTTFMSVPDIDISVSLPNIFHVNTSGNPITSTGQLSVQLVSQSANLVLSSPNGSSGNPTFRSLVAADIPSLDADKITTGTISTARLGAGTADTTTYLRGDGSWSTVSSLPTQTGNAGKYLTTDGSSASWATVSSGTVTSVALSLPNIFTITSSPITSSGTLTAILANQAGNVVLASPANGTLGTPTFRNLTSADIPSLNANKITSGTIDTARLGSGTADSTTYLRGDGSWATVSSGSGTVTSVALSLPAIFSVSGSPVTSTGTLSATLASQTGNVIFGSPSDGSSGSPTFRSLVAADIPSLDAAKITTGTIATARLGSGTANSTTYLRGDGSWATVSSGSGTVTSVALSLPAIFSVSGSPVTSSGTLSASLASQTGNVIFGSPSDGSSGSPTFRSLVAADIPSLDAAKITSGTIGTARLGSGTADSTTYLRGDGSWATVSSGSGTVTSVALSLPAIFSVSGSPVTSTGTLSATLASQTGNVVFASPSNGSSGSPTFRSLVAADIPNLNTSKLTSGTLSATLLPALSGDVTTSAGSAVTTIASNAVTYAKIQNVTATNRLLGRASSGSGVVEEITIGSGLTLSGTTLSASGGGGSSAYPESSVPYQLNTIARTRVSNGDSNGIVANAGNTPTITITVLGMFRQDNNASVNSIDTGSFSRIINRVFNGSEGNMGYYGFDNLYIKVQFSTQVVINQITNFQGTGRSNTFTMTLKGSNDNTNWTTIDTTGSVYIESGTWGLFSFTNSTGYYYYQVCKNGGANEWFLEELEFYGSVPSNSSQGTYTLTDSDFNKTLVTNTALINQSHTITIPTGLTVSNGAFSYLRNDSNGSVSYAAANGVTLTGNGNLAQGEIKRLLKTGSNSYRIDPIAGDTNSVLLAVNNL